MGSGAFLVAACRYLARRVRSGARSRRRVPRRRDIDERTARSSGERSPSGACTASTSIRWRCSSRGCRCGSRRSPPTGRSAFSIIVCRSATACSARGSRTLRQPPTRRAGSARRGARRRLPLFDDERRRRRAARGAAGPLLARVDAERHHRAGAREGARVHGADSGRRVALALEAGRASLVRRLVRRPDELRAAAAFGALSDAALTGRSALPTATARPIPRRGRVNRRRAPAVSLGARIPRSVLRAGRRTSRAAGVRRGDRQSAVGHDPRRRRRRRRARARARQRSRPRCGSPAIPASTRAQSHGHANRYQLFVERAIALTRDGGRLGLVLPSGLATDHGSAPLRRLLFSRCDVDAIVGMDNHRGVFPDPPKRPLSARHGDSRRADARHRMPTRRGRSGRARCDRQRPVACRPAACPCGSRRALLERISGDALAIPNVRGPIDLEIAERAAALFAPLGSVTGWQRAVRPRAERDRRSRAFRVRASAACRSSTASTSSRSASRSTRSHAASRRPTRAGCCAPIATSVRGSPTATSRAPPIG